MSPFVQIGIGVGACVGAVITCILFVVGMIIVKVLKIQRERRKGTYITSSSIYFYVCLEKAEAESSRFKNVAMEKNMAYELHKPRRKGHTAPQQALNPIYEDLK